MNITIGTNNTIEYKGYTIEWCNSDRYLNDDECSYVSIKHEDWGLKCIPFHKNTLEQDIQIANQYFIDRDVDVRFVEDKTVELANRISKLEDELEKLRGMIK